MLKVALLSYGYGYKDYGHGTYIYNLARLLPRFGFSPAVFGPDFQVQSLGLPIFQFRNLVRKLRAFHVLHSNEAAGVLVPHPCVVETAHHNYWEQERLLDRMFARVEAFACDRAEKVIAPSNMTGKILRGRGIPQNKVEVIYHGVDHAIFRREESLRNHFRREFGLTGFVIISVGRLVHHKHHADLIRIAAKISDSTIVIVGRGNERGHIRALADKLRVRLIQVERLSTADLVGLLNASDVYAHGSTVEGFGLSVLEAMACGLPVVAFDVGDFPLILQGCGITVPKLDFDEMEEGIRVLSEDSELRGKLAAEGISRSNRFSWENTAALHARVYREALQRSADVHT